MKRLEKSMAAKGKLLYITCIFLIPLFVFMVGYTFYSNQVLKSRLAETNMGRVVTYQSFVEKDLINIEYFMSDLIANDSAYNCLRYPLDNLDTYLQMYNITEKMDSVLKTIDCVDVLSVTTLKSGMFCGSFSENWTSEDKEALKKTINEILQTKGDDAIGKWELYCVNGIEMFLKIMGGNEVYCICGIKADSISMKQQEDEYILISKQNTPISYIEEVQERGVQFENKTYYLAGQRKYFVVQAYSEILDSNFVLMTPYQGIWNLESGTMIWVIAMLLFLALLYCCYRMLKKEFLRPLENMVTTMEMIGEGEVRTRLDVTSHVTEYEKLESTFNQMMDKIQELRILAYDRLIEKQQTELQYYQIQIRPHFFLNCMKNLYAMSVEQKYNQMQEMILSLSDYLRFVFREQTITVSLQKEMDSVRAYVHLQQLSNSKPPVYKEEIESSLKNFQIPPLSILTFVENSVRYARVTEEEFTISVTAKLLNYGMEQYVNITILDNGCGFSEESLTILNDKNRRMPKEHVGIHNAKKRFALLYDDTCSFSFSNRNGACVDIFIPWSENLKGAGVEKKGVDENECFDC